MSIRGAANLAGLTAIVALCLVAATVLDFHPSICATPRSGLPVRTAMAVAGG